MPPPPPAATTHDRRTGLEVHRAEHPRAPVPVTAGRLLVHGPFERSAPGSMCTEILWPGAWHVMVGASRQARYGYDLRASAVDDQFILPFYVVRGAEAKLARAVFDLLDGPSRTPPSAERREAIESRHLDTPVFVLSFVARVGRLPRPMSAAECRAALVPAPRRVPTTLDLIGDAAQADALLEALARTMRARNRAPAPRDPAAPAAGERGGGLDVVVWPGLARAHVHLRSAPVEIDARRPLLEAWLRRAWTDRAGVPMEILRQRFGATYTYTALFWRDRLVLSAALDQALAGRATRGLVEAVTAPAFWRARLPDDARAILRARWARAGTKLSPREVAHLAAARPWLDGDAPAAWSLRDLDRAFRRARIALAVPKLTRAVRDDACALARTLEHTSFDVHVRRSRDDGAPPRRIACPGRGTR